MKSGQRFDPATKTRQYINRLLSVTLLFLAPHLSTAQEQQPDYLEQALALTTQNNLSDHELYVLISNAYFCRGNTGQAFAVLHCIENIEDRIKPPFYGMTHARTSAYARIAKAYAKNGQFDEALQTANALPDTEKFDTLLEIADILSDDPPAAGKSVKLAAQYLDQVDSLRWKVGGLVKIDAVCSKTNYSREQ